MLTVMFAYEDLQKELYQFFLSHVILNGGT